MIARKFSMIFTIYASACFSASNPQVKALAILFLALWFFADTSLTISSGSLHFQAVPSLLNNIIVFWSIKASIAIALGSAVPTFHKTLAVSLQTFCLFAGASSFLFFLYNFLLLGFTFTLEGNFKRIRLKLVDLLLKILIVIPDKRVQRDILLGFNK